MKKELLFIGMVITMLLSSCTYYLYDIRGSYPTNNSIETDIDYDQVWDNVIDFFAENNIAISTVEKASGLIAAKDLKLSGPMVTYEDKDGKIHNQAAWFVMPYEANIIGGDVYCSFNVRVRQNENGKTTININIGNIVGYPHIQDILIGKVVRTVPAKQCISTGVFEQLVLDQCK